MFSNKDLKSVLQQLSLTRSEFQRYTFGFIFYSFSERDIVHLFFLWRVPPPPIFPWDLKYQLITSGSLSKEQHTHTTSEQYWMFPVMYMAWKEDTNTLGWNPYLRSKVNTFWEWGMKMCHTSAELGPLSTVSIYFSISLWILSTLQAAISFKMLSSLHLPSLCNGSFL